MRERNREEQPAEETLDDNALRLFALGAQEGARSFRIDILGANVGEADERRYGRHRFYLSSECDTDVWTAAPPPFSGG